MARGLENGTAIVTGGATLIGRAVVRAFHEAGAKVAVADIDAEGGRDAGRASSGRASLRGDRHPRRRAGRTASSAETVERFGGIDFLVNLACSYVDDGFGSPRADWLESLNVNVVSAVMMAAGRASAHGRAGRRRDRQLHLDLVEGRADRPLALPGRARRRSCS